MFETQQQLPKPVLPPKEKLLISLCLEAKYVAKLSLMIAEVWFWADCESMYS